MNNSKPTVSILTTCYNRETFLGECIESVQKSHYQDYEHIIVDDCSTDQSAEIARNYAAEDNRIRVFVNEKNLGDYPNRNKAASYAKGEFLKYLDADDMHGRFKLDILVDAIQQYPTAALAFTDTGPNKPAFPKLLSPAELFEAHYTGKHPVFGRSPLNVIIRAKHFNIIGGFSEQRSTGDFEFWHLVSQKFPCVITCGVPGLWRLHENQESQLYRVKPIVPFKYLLISRRFLLDPETPISEEFRGQVIRRINRRIGRSILRVARQLDFRSMMEMKRISGHEWIKLLKDSFT